MEGNQTLMIKANDTDVVMVAISILPSLQELGLQKLWIAFGQEKKSEMDSNKINDIFSVIAPKKYCGILFFHDFTGCDTVSAFRGKGKKSAWKIWNVCNDASSVFKKLGTYTQTVGDEDTENLEKFVIALYDRSSTATRVNDAQVMRSPANWGWIQEVDVWRTCWSTLSPILQQVAKN